MALNQFVKSFFRWNTIKNELQFIKSRDMIQKNFRLMKWTQITQRNHESIGSVMPKIRSGIPKQLIFLPVGLLSFFTKDEETPEDKMINTIKRSVLAIQDGDYSKAEKMLHLALRMAQDLQNRDGITYIFDMMANVALDAGHLDKAHKLFVNVMQRLLQDGYKEDDNKMLHISAKLAYIEYLQEHLDRSKIGFEWVLSKINEKLKSQSDDMDLVELCGLVKDHYAHLLIQEGNFKEAKKYFLEAYEIFTQFHGNNNPEVVNLLNNLAVVCTNLNDITNAEIYLNEAIVLAKQFPELDESGIFQANQGILLIKKGLLDEASKICSLAWRSAKKSNNQEGLEQADYCIKQIEAIQSQAK